MTNMNRYLLALVGMFFIVGVAQARVCFLPGGEDEAEFCLESVPFGEKLNCPGYTTCAHPKSGAQACTEDDGTQKYPQKSDCCEDTINYEECLSGAVCESGHSCNSNGYESCDRGHCICPDKYKTCGENQVGIGTPCEDAGGVKYLECQCKEDFHVCGNKATGSGETCQDDRGTLYSICTCPTGWETSSGNCSCGVSEECINYPGGSKSYSCIENPIPDCKCGYTYKSSHSGCFEGCTDSEFDIIGSSISSSYDCTQTQGLNGNVCGKNCKCAKQSWDVETCPYPECSKLGYTETNCSGEWLACPFDSTKKKCLPE